ncbi:collagen alpha-1(III) chain-like, partial [Anoplophora glabripennis]|uniref:collagen alpha-1(III) chain-like n=1 Tax=Anoplophora glabripennis TaxID=217634 RepID=UPI000873D5A3
PASSSGTLPFGTQQSSGATQLEDQQPSAGYSGLQQPGAPAETQKSFGTQQATGAYPSGIQPGIPSGAQQIFPSSGQPGASGATPNPFETQQLPGSHPSGIPSETQSFTGYPGSGQPGVTSGSQRPFGTQQSFSGSQPGTPSGTQQPFVGFPSSGQSGEPSGFQRPFGTQQPSNGPQPGIPSGTQQPLGGYPSSKQPGAPSGTTGTFGTQSSGNYPSGSQLGTAGGTQQPSSGYSGSRQPGTSSGTSGPFGTDQSSGGYPNLAQSGTPTGTQVPFETQRPDYPGSGAPSVQKPLSGFPGEQRQEIVDSQQPGYPGSALSSGTQGPSTGFLGEQRPEAGRIGDSQRPGLNIPSVNGRPQDNLPRQNQQGYNYPEPQKSFAGEGQPRENRPGVSSGFEQRPSVSTASNRPGLTGSSQFPSGEVAGPILGSYPNPSTQLTSSGPSTTEQQVPNGYFQSRRPQGSVGYPGAEAKYPGGAQSERPTGKQGRGDFTGERRPTEQFPIGQTNGPRSEGTTEGQFQSNAVTPSSGFSREQEPSKGRVGYSQTGRPTGSQFPSDRFVQTTGSLDGPGFPREPTGQVNGYSDITTQQQTPDLKSNELSDTGKPARPQIPSQSSSASQGKPGSTSYPQNGQRPLSSYLPPGERGSGTGGLPLSETPASQFPSSGTTSFGSRAPSTSRLPFGRSDKSTGFGNGFGGSTQPGGGVSFDGKPSGFPQQPVSSGFDASGTPTGRIPSGGRPFGSQFTSGESGPQQGTNGYSRPGKPSTSQFGQPGATGSSERGHALEGATQEGFSRESAQGPRDSVPGQPRYYNGESSFEEDEGDYSAIPGQPGRDYPILSEVPETSFDCDDQEYRGYYADVETRCQIFHICANNKTYDFLCPNGTIFHQEHLVCVWWNQFDCDAAPSLYRVNENIYDFSITGAQKTGGIPVPGQDYPDLSEGFPSTGVAGQGPGTDFGGVRPGGYPGEESIAPTGPGSSRRPSTGIQRPGDYPSGRPQESIGRYPGVTTQGTEERPSGGLQRPSSVVERPGGYPSGKPQEPTSGYPSTNSQEYPSGGQQRPGSGVQRPGGYPSGRPQESTGVYPGGTSQGIEERPSGGLQRPSSGVQKPEGYPSGRPQSTSRYPSTTSQGTQEYPSGGFQRPSNEVQKPGGYPNKRPQDSIQPSSVGYSNGRPQETGGSQFPGGERPAGGVSGFEGPAESTSTGYPDRSSNAQTQGYPNVRPSGTGGSQISAPGQFGGPGSVGVFQPGRQPSEGSQGVGFPSGRPAAPDRQKLPQYGVPEGPTSQTQRPGISVSSPQGPSGYPTVTPAGFPVSSVPSLPNGSGSLFPGSPQPHQPTRDYLPTV